MSKISFFVLIIAVTASIPICLSADSGNVLFFDQNGQNTTFSSDKIQTLKMRIVLPNPVTSYKFDYIQVVLSPSYNSKMEWRIGWMIDELGADSLSEIILVPKSRLVNGYSSSFILEDIKEFPSAKGIDSLTLNATVRIFKKTGETKETKWDKNKEKYITETIYQWNEGTQIASGSASFKVPKISAENKQSNDIDKVEKLKQLNEIRKKMGKPPLTELP